MISIDTAAELRIESERERLDDVYFPGGGDQPQDYYEARLRYIVSSPSKYERLRPHAREIVLHHDRRRRMLGGAL